MESKKATLSIGKVQDMVQIALMAAITYIATAVINIPSGVIVKGVVHLGDSMVFLAAAIGMCMFDLLSPYAIWAPFTFVIKGTMAYIAGVIAYRNNYEGNNIFNNILAFALGGIWMIAAYYCAGVILMHFTGNIAFSQAFVLATAEIPGNIAQVVAGIVLAIPLGKILKKANVIKK